MAFSLFIVFGPGTAGLIFYFPDRKIAFGKATVKFPMQTLQIPRLFGFKTSFLSVVMLYKVVAQIRSYNFVEHYEKN